MFIYMNGEIVRKEEAAISPFEHGFLYGMGVFETFRVYNGHPFLLDDHLERLNSSLQAIDIKAQYTREPILEALQQLLAMNDFSNAYIRLNVSAGAGEIGLPTEPYSDPNLIIFAKPLSDIITRQEKMAILLKLRRNTPEGLERLKSHHYLNNILAKKEVGEALDREGIFLTGDGFLAEGIVSNLFWIRNGVLFTPSVETGILNGVTRRFILKLASREGLEIQEGFFVPEQVLEADEVFVTNSIQEVVPISSFEGHPMQGLAGSMVKDLHLQYERYRELLWSRKEL